MGGDIDNEFLYAPTLADAAEEWGAEAVDRLAPMENRESEPFSIRTINAAFKLEGWLRGKPSRQELAEHLKRRKVQILLRTELLVGFGFALPRGPGAAPEYIPRDIWDAGEIDWEHSAVVGGGREFVNVRIFTVRDDGQLLGQGIEKDFDEKLRARIDELTVRFAATTWAPPKRQAGPGSRLADNPRHGELRALVAELVERGELHGGMTLKARIAVCLRQTDKGAPLHEHLRATTEKTFGRWTNDLIP